MTKPTNSRSRTWTVAISAGAGLVIGATAVSGISASWADPSGSAQPAQVQLTEQRPVTSVDPATRSVSGAGVWAPVKMQSTAKELFSNVRDLAADHRVETVSVQSVQSIENQVSVQSAQSTSWDSPDSPDSPASWDSPDSPASWDSPDSPASWDSPDSPASWDSPDSPASWDSPDSPDSPDSWDSPDSPDSWDSVDSPDW